MFLTGAQGPCLPADEELEHLRVRMASPMDLCKVIDPNAKMEVPPKKWTGVFNIAGTFNTPL